jgi:virginiamycin B lyase
VRPGAAVKLRFFNTPTAASWPDYVTRNNDGNIWFTEFYADKVGRITPSGAITEFGLPSGNDVEGIVASPDGNVWFTEPGANKVATMNSKGLPSFFPIDGPNPSPRGIIAGQHGDAWFVDYYGDKIGRIAPKGHMTQFTIPQAESYPWWITMGSDGDLWFTESATNMIGRFDPRTSKFEAPLKVPGSYPTPWGIMTAPDGRIWFTERRAGNIAVIANGTIKTFHIAQAKSYPDTIVMGPDNLMYITENQAAAIARFDPATGKFLPDIALPSGDIPTGIAVGGDGNIWFAVANYTEPNSIGEIVLH